MIVAMLGGGTHNGEMDHLDLRPVAGPAPSVAPYGTTLSRRARAAASACVTELARFIIPPMSSPEPETCLLGMRQTNHQWTPS